MLPKDTISYTKYILNEATTTAEYIITSEYPSTILGFSFEQKGKASEINLNCGEELIFNHFEKTTAYTELNRTCNDILKVDIIDNDEAMIVVNYIPYVDNATTTTANFTYGEILTNLFLFVLILGFITGFLIKNFIIKKK